MSQVKYKIVTRPKVMTQARAAYCPGCNYGVVAFLVSEVLEELNISVIRWLKKEFACPVGYSGHETGVVQPVMAAVLGACVIEKHITLDRAMWGSDQAASLEPNGLNRLVRDIRNLSMPGLMSNMIPL